MKILRTKTLAYPITSLFPLSVSNDARSTVAQTQTPSILSSKHGSKHTTQGGFRAGAAAGPHPFHSPAPGLGRPASLSETSTR